MARETPPGRPPVEPEIIPPTESGARAAGRQSRVWISIRTSGGQKPPFLAVLLAALGGLFVIAILVVLLSATLVLIPIIAALVAVLLLFGLVRGYRRGRRMPDSRR